ncbi:MAG: alpha/beta hydrolase [Carnobacterium alterfunditum]
MEINNFWVDNNGTNIHFMESNFKANQDLPFIIIPGLSETAEDYLPLLKAFAPRRCIVITLRGRGNSDAPLNGYTLENHISDIDAVIKHLGLTEITLMGFSRGVSYTLGYALDHIDSVKGLVLGDYPALHSQLPPEWADFFSALPPWRGRALSERMKTHAIDGLQKDSKYVAFWDELNAIKCPVLVIRGGKQGSALSITDGKKYVEKIPQANLVVFEESDHNIFEPKVDRFVDRVEQFLTSIKS